MVWQGVGGEEIMPRQRAQHFQKPESRVPACKGGRGTENQGASAKILG